MERISFGKLCEIMSTYNARFPEKQEEAHLSGVIVYKQSNFDKPYSETSRSYRVSNNNRAFQHGKIANSIFGHCLDGTDDGVRLDWYKWAVDYCYMEDVVTA